MMFGKKLAESYTTTWSQILRVYTCNGIEREFYKIMHSTCHSIYLILTEKYRFKIGNFKNKHAHLERTTFKTKLC